MRTALGIGAYLAASAVAAMTLSDNDGNAWFVSTALIHVALAAAGRRLGVLLLPLLFMAALAVSDKLIIRSNGGDDCHDWCGDMVLTGGFVIFWLPLAMLTTATTLVMLGLGRLLHQTR